MFSLFEKIVVITGGGSGLGLATVQRFVAAGAVVVMADITESNQLAKKSGCHFHQVDVTSEIQVEELMKKTCEKFGKLDVVINNAGIIMPEQLINNAETSYYEQLHKVNVMGVLYGIKYGARYMKDGGTIINTASNSANGDYAGYGAYIASKTAVVGLTKAAAIEYAPRGIRVNCICPNTIDTPMAYAEGCETELKVMRITTPLGRMCKPEEGAALFHFLASDDCKYITGEDIYIDGGLKAGPSTQMITALINNNSSASLN